MGKIVAAMATMHAPQLFTRPPEEDPQQLDAGIAAMRKLGKILDETNPDALVILASIPGWFGRATRIVKLKLGFGVSFTMMS